MDAGRATRRMETASLDMGKAQGNHSPDACSWWLSRATY